jgi:hypothetical protein
MKWWTVALCVGLLVFSLVLVYEKIRSDRTISGLDSFSQTLQRDKQRLAAELEFLRIEVDASGRIIERLERENAVVRKQLEASLERSAILETLLDDSSIITEGITGEIDEATKLVEEVIERIKIDRAAITGSSQ